MVVRERTELLAAYVQTQSFGNIRSLYSVRRGAFGKVVHSPEELEPPVLVRSVSVKAISPSWQLSRTNGLMRADGDESAMNALLRSARRGAAGRGGAGLGSAVEVHLALHYD